jgi:hypothetical protein
MKKALICTLSIVLLSGMIWIFIAKLGFIANVEKNLTHYSIPKQIHFSFTLQNTTNRMIKKAEFCTYAPVKQTATQKCVQIRSSHPYRLVNDDLGNQILHFTFNNLPPYAAKIITIKTDLLLSRNPNPLPEDLLQRYLGPEKNIESDDADINRLAQKLKVSNRLITAQNFFCWVADNVHYTGYMHKARGARYALAYRKGDCTEFMDLFVALCRADRIPARGIGGYVVKAGAILKPARYHNWAEFYDDGAWHLADPQNKAFMQNHTDYIAMRIISASADTSLAGFSRFSFKGEGLKVSMK